MSPVHGQQRRQPPSMPALPGAQLSFTPSNRRCKLAKHSQAPTLGLCPANTSPSLAKEQAPSRAQWHCWCQLEASASQAALTSSAAPAGTEGPPQ